MTIVHTARNSFWNLILVCSICLLKLSSQRLPSIHSSYHHLPSPMLQRMLVYCTCTHITFATHFTVLSIVYSIRLLKLSSHRPPSIYSSYHHSPNPILQRRFNLLLVYYTCTTHFHFTVAYRMIWKDNNCRRGQSVYQVAG